ncbi:homeobox protein AKR-like [Hyalella azteca]|uniref:Homeobox protein AKR-like n=1 Tax=Hyalella azteca TaxID=294128 RepID=A0A8B7NUS5_HYAAZ|nr:homeobox protein AKR-like [Hyalella azteca]
MDSHLQNAAQAPQTAATRNIVQPTQAPEGTSVARKRRPNLRPEAKAVLTAWLTEHRHHPYPTEEEKDALVCEAGVTLAQLNQWSVNARRRKLPKLQLEDGSPPSDTTSTTTRQRRAVGENNRNDRRARSHRVVLLEGSPGNVVQLPPPPEDTSYLLLLADLTVERFQEYSSDGSGGSVAGTCSPASSATSSS